MPRPMQDGLRYFSFDTDFFYADKRIRKLHSRYGNDGIVMYIYLLTEIYRNGYFARWDEDLIDDMLELHLAEGFIEQCLEYLVGRSLLVKRILSNSVTVITAPGIQKRYQAAVKKQKRDFIVDDQIWLLNKEETEPCIKVTKNTDKSEKNTDKSEKNTDKSEKNTIKEKKRKEIKINNNTMCKADAFALFESLWKLYPNKRGKGRVSEKDKRTIAEIGFEEMKRAIERYLEGLAQDEWRKPQNGSTFFHSGYIDYLDRNFNVAEEQTVKTEEPETEPEEDEDYDWFNDPENWKQWEGQHV